MISYADDLATLDPQVLEDWLVKQPQRGQFNWYNGTCGCAGSQFIREFTGNPDAESSVVSWTSVGWDESFPVPDWWEAWQRRMLRMFATTYNPWLTFAQALQALREVRKAQGI